MSKADEVELQDWQQWICTPTKFLSLLIDRRGQIDQEFLRAQQKSEAVFLLAREQGRQKLEPEENREFCKYRYDMELCGAELLVLDKRIQELRAHVGLECQCR